jgi:L-fucose mutarotase/ribose pyranase (RbsD/FucU family)
MIEPVRTGYAVVFSGERRRHGNIVLRNGVIASEGGRP